MSEVQMYQSEVGRLEREILDEQAKDPVLSQNIRVWAVCYTVDCQQLQGKNFVSDS